MNDMAITAFEILGVLKLDKDDFDKGLDSAKTGAMALAGGVATAAKVGMAAIGAATTAAVGFGKTAIDAATSYESAFTGVKKTVDATEEEYGRLSDWIMDASTKMASSKEDIAATMEIAGQLGIRGVDGLEKFTETMIMLGDTTNLNAEEAASALAKFGNIAGVGATDMDRIGSVIVDLGNHFATTEQDIVNMSTRLASAGTIAGFSATDILALSTAMSSVGLNAEAGGTAMSTIMTKIGRAVDEGVSEDNEKLALFAKTAGMTAEEFATAWKTAPTTALQGFVKGLDGVIDSGGNVTAILDDLAIKGIRETNTIKSLSLASDVLTSAVDTANTAFEENTALQHEAGMRYGTTESKAIQTAEAFKNLKVAIGEELQPAYAELMSFAGTAMQKMTEGFQEGGLNGLMESLGSALSEGLGMLVEKLPAAVDAGMQLLGALGQGLIDNAPQLLSTIMQIGDMVGDVIMGLLNNIDTSLQNVDWVGLASKIAEFMRNGLSDESQFLSTASSIISSLVSGIGQALPELIPAAIEVITSLANDLAEQIPTLMESAADLLMGLVEGLTEPNALNNIIDSAINIIMALVDGLIKALPKLIEAAPVIIANLVEALVKAIPKLIVAAVEIIMALQKGIMDNLPKIAESAIKIIGELSSGIIKLKNNLFKAAVEIIEKFRDGIKKFDPAEWGKDMIESLVRGIKNAIGKVKEAVGEVANTIKEYLHFSEPDVGPLANFHTYAPDMMNLFAEGIKDNTRLVTDQIQKSFDFSDVIADQNVNVGGQNGGVVINVYGAEGQDEMKIAEAVSDILVHQKYVAGAVYA